LNRSRSPWTRRSTAPSASPIPRQFELLLSVEPAVVREAAEAAVALAAPIAPEVGERARGALEQLAPPRPEAQLRLSGAITARLLAALRGA
jgi:hypothetical protein